VYVWADGIHVNIRLEEHKLCLLVLIGVRSDGRKELIALADGYRESAESWADLLRDCARPGMSAPVLAVGDGALGFWGALREVFPTTREQRCWFHKSANVLGALPKSAHPGAKKALAEIWNAEDRHHALDAVSSFKAVYGAKFPKAAAKITDDLAELLAFTTSRPSTGFICGPRMKSSTPSRAAGCGIHFSARPPLQPEPPGRSRGQGGAPAAQRGRTTLTAVRTGVGSGGGGRGRPRREVQGVGLSALPRRVAPRGPR
jgi:hypothetical protein